MAAGQVLFMMPPVPRRKERHYRVSNLQGLTDTELRARYRFGRESIDYLTDLLRDDLQRATIKKTNLTVEQQVMIALRFYSSGSFLQVVGDTLGCDKGTVSRVVDRVTDALLVKKNDFIKWPLENTDQHEVKNGFYSMRRFPNVLGCIDCTHVRIQAPSQDEPAFVNRKGYHSVNVQAVCDHQGKFTNITANWPGSVHDSHIFKTSSLGRFLEGNPGVLENGFLLGDSGYACRPFLLTPFLRPQHRYQQRFNGAHASTRSTIERAFGILKRRFHVLHSEIRMKPEKVCRIFGACAILHNIAIDRREPLDDDEIDVQQPLDVPDFNGAQDGRAMREHIARTFF